MLLHYKAEREGEREKGGRERERKEGGREKGRREREREKGGRERGRERERRERERKEGGEGKEGGRENSRGFIDSKSVHKSRYTRLREHTLMSILGSYTATVLSYK